MRKTKMKFEKKSFAWAIEQMKQGKQCKHNKWFYKINKTGITCFSDEKCTQPHCNQKIMHHELNFLYWYIY